MDIIGLVCFALIFSVFSFVRLRITSHFNPAYLLWLFYGAISILATALSAPLRINIFIYLSLLSCFIVFVRFKPPIVFIQHKESLWSSVSLCSFGLGCVVFFLPILIDISNTSGIEASSFGDRNSTIASMPIAVISRSLSSLALPILFLSRKTCRTMYFCMISLVFLFLSFTFSYTSSKGAFLAIPLYLAAIAFSEKVFKTYALDKDQNKVFKLNRITSPLPLVSLTKFHSLRFSRMLLCVLVSVACAAIGTILILQRLNFPIDLLIFRISYNYDTLMFISDAIERGIDVGAGSSGFFSLISIYLKPFLGLIGISDGYVYRSVPQFVMSAYSGSYWTSSSLGNSNLIAESVVSSSLVIGCLTAPVFYYLYLRFVQFMFKSSFGDPFLLVVAFSLYFKSYDFFSSSQEVIMNSVPLILLFCIRYFFIRISATYSLNSSKSA